MVMINVWNMKPDDVVLIGGKRFRLKRDFKQHRPTIGVVPIRELVEIENKKNKQRFIYGIDVELEVLDDQN